MTMPTEMRLAAISAMVVVLAACEPSQDVPSTRNVPGAVIETRDGPTRAELQRKTQVVVLGTGTPLPDAHRAGPSIAVIHKGEAYLFDVGAGAIHNAIIARYKYDIPSLYPNQICCVFFTHMHSDHTMDYAELAFTLWWRRTRKLSAFGPIGLESMNEGMVAMMATDIAIRTSGTQPVPSPDGYKVDVTEISEGVVFRKGDLTIEAFEVSHGNTKPAYGYRITTEDKTLVISGDTAHSEKLLEMSRGVDLLFHEVISDSGLAKTPDFWQAYHKRSHTLASELGKLATEARPKMLVLYHGLYYGVPETVVVDEVRANYEGDVVLANDLDSF